MTRARIARNLAAGLLAGALVGGAAIPAHAAEMTCQMRYHMKGWSVFYKTAQGTGTVTCTDGETAKVKLHTVGGGAVVGKSSTDDGQGTFTGVRKLADIFGDYASAQAEAGATRAAHATVVSKGEVSLALTGTGRGWTLGVSGSKFSIQPDTTHGFK